MKKKILLSCLVGCCLFSFTSGFAATEIYVSKTKGNDMNPGTKESPYGTVEKAVGAVKASTETVIYLEENVVFDIAKLDLDANKIVSIIGNNTTLRAAEKPGKEGGQGNRILRAVGGTELKLKGLIFENGRQVEYYPGGAIFFAGKSLDVDSCKFINNETGSSGGAIASRAKETTIRNSYFDGNYTYGGGGTGGAIMNCGPASGEMGSFLIVENCTFNKNQLTIGGQGSAIATYDATLAGGKYCTLESMTISNCTFLENSSTDAYQAAVDICSSPLVETYIVNNTFYNNDGALRMDNYVIGSVNLVNNVIYANKASILSEYTSAEGREPVVAYNNIFVGTERGVNEGMDEPCLNNDRATYNNVVETLANYAFSKVALSTTLSTDNFVPYLAITTSSSTLVNAGLDDSTEALGKNVVSSTDVRNYGKNGTRDIGAFEFDGIPPIVGIGGSYADAQDFFALDQTQDAIVVENISEKNISVRILALDGRTVYTSNVADQVTINKSALPKGVVIIAVSNGVNTKAQKLILK